MPLRVHSGLKHRVSTVKAFEHQIHHVQWCSYISSIIAVHGLGAHRDYAWLHKKDPAKGIINDVNWLKDLLPETLQASKSPIQPRIFCFNYDSRWLGGEVSKQRIMAFANQLLDATQVARNQVSRIRIFIYLLRIV